MISDIASRMESTGVPGNIHISEDTYDMLRHEPGWQPTGGIEVKGKGLMRTYLWTPPQTSEDAVTQPPPMNHGSPLMTHGLAPNSAGGDGSGSTAATVRGIGRRSAPVPRILTAAGAVPFKRAAEVAQGRGVQGLACGQAMCTWGGGSRTGPTAAIPDPRLLLEQMEVLAKSIAQCPSPGGSGGVGGSNGDCRSEMGNGTSAATTAATKTFIREDGEQLGREGSTGGVGTGVALCAFGQAPTPDTRPSASDTTSTTTQSIASRSKPPNKTLNVTAVGAAAATGAGAAASTDVAAEADTVHSCSASTKLVLGGLGLDRMVSRGSSSGAATAFTAAADGSGPLHRQPPTRFGAAESLQVPRPSGLGGPIASGLDGNSRSGSGYLAECHASLAAWHRQASGT